MRTVSSILWGLRVNQKAIQLWGIQVRRCWGFNNNSIDDGIKEPWNFYFFKFEKNSPWISGLDLIQTKSFLNNVPLCPPLLRGQKFIFDGYFDQWEILSSENIFVAKTSVDTNNVRENINPVPHSRAIDKVGKVLYGKKNCHVTSW